MKFFSWKYLVLFGIFASGFLKAQITFGKSVRFIPGISCGYTFGKGLNATVDCAVTALNYKLNNMPSYTGLHVSYSVFSHKKELYDNGFYRAISFNIMNVVNHQLITRLGLARTKLKWGYESRNSKKSNGWGFNADLAVSPIANYPFIGFRKFFIMNQCLGLGGSNPKFLYLGYQYPIEIYRPIKTGPTR
ncbi:MAG: hypothetical protein IAF38_19390 [Bacteroidia bacterium]|nr:hypothetical protein [Bacteroidia bacterium]